MSLDAPAPSQSPHPADLREACRRLEACAPTPLLIVDVDEVLALFVQGFDRWLRREGFELRMNSFALFSNLYPVGGDASASLADGKRLFDRFFAEGCHEVEAAPGASQGLERISQVARIVVLTNAPQSARALRAEWLTLQALDHPLVINAGPKGVAASALATAAGGPCAFVDDLLSNLDSVAAEAPHVTRFQMVADPHLRPMAPTAPERHTRVDDWPELTERLVALFG